MGHLLDARSYRMDACCTRRSVLAVSIQKVDAALVIDIRRNNETWCVYEHQVVMKQGEPPETIMIGACRLVDLFHLRDGKTNSEWAQIFTNGGQVLVRIVATTLNRPDAFRHAAELVRDSRPAPRCNLLGYNMRSSRRPVICLNNGKRYETQRHAALELGIHESAISRHLRGFSDAAQGMKFAYAMAVTEEHVENVA